MKLFIGLFLGIMLAVGGSILADKIPSPPPLKVEPDLYHYLRTIYENFHRLEVVTSNPDGSRAGKKGDMLHLQSGGAFYHCENTDSNTTWRCANLTDIP